MCEQQERKREREVPQTFVEGKYDLNVSKDLAVVLFRDEVQPQQRMEEYLNEEDEEEENENKFAHTYTRTHTTLRTLITILRSSTSSDSVLKIE